MRGRKNWHSRIEKLGAVGGGNALKRSVCIP